MRLLCCLTFIFAGCFALHAEEPDDRRILQQILSTRDAIQQIHGDTNAIFLAFWDFDGTTMKGDCSEGLQENGKLIFPGLAQVAIEHGLSQIYPRAGGFDKFWNDYTNMDTHVGHWLAYPFIPQMLRGARADDVLQLSRDYFSTTLSNYLRASSVHIIHELAGHGVQSHIISASADLFVKGAADSLGIPRAHIHGIQVNVREGRLTGELIYPLTWNVGKRETIQQIVAETERAQPGKKVYVLAGFGDSYATDGPFLKFIATQQLPAGKPISVFYDNTNAPDEYRGLFYQASHFVTVSGR
ncbi:MAG TPA: haloacid dehalogenase-like hydrolase [Verrucomicrobiae bacterium]|jgi:phosphoserine phosphatase